MTLITRTLSASVIVGLTTVLFGCSTAGTAIPLTSKIHPPTTKESIEILSKSPNRAHEEIALVDGIAATDDYFTQEKTLEAAMGALKEKAANLGANAVVITNRSARQYGGIWEKIQISGTAIRYTE